MRTGISPTAFVGMLGREEPSWSARASWPASRITLGWVGCLDNCNASSTGQSNVNPVLGAERVVRPVADNAETEQPRRLRRLANDACSHPGRASPRTEGRTAASGDRGSGTPHRPLAVQ